MLRFAALVLLLACGHAPAASDDAATPDAGLDAGPSCLEPDRACPEFAPIPGHPCVAPLECNFEDRFVSRCVDGTWEIELLCTGCNPPTVERCAEPSTAALPGARFVIGPVDEARAYADGEDVDVVYGLQGLPMVPYTLRIAGVEDPPSCISYQGEAELVGYATARIERTIRLHCGASRVAYLTLIGDCEPGRVDELHFRLTIDGVAEAATAHVRSHCPAVRPR
ncbi:MAG: hypothetical protein H6720_20580 [Sandaracinus sp.]|nr:hypothetical protein [Sandaracinus sp.]